MDLVRREIKFQIPLSLVEPISKYLENYCSLDKYSEISPTKYYTINSLYLDSDHMVLLENKRANLPRRFSMRIRSYGDNPKYPAFLETKKKHDQFINKRRSQISSNETIEFIKNGISCPDNTDIIHPFFRTACYNIISLGLAPKMMTQYKRKAYFGLLDPYSRVTFDRDMRCYQESDYNIFPIESKFSNYDHIFQYNDGANANVVLELKCEDKIPFWMSNLIQKFNLRQAQFSKFDSSWTYLTDLDYIKDSFILGNI